jgi:hypothetical protein
MRPTSLTGTMIILLACTLVAIAAGYSVLEGRVVDDQGKPQANVPVYLELPKGPIVAFTDARGVFQFINLEPGEYIVFVKGGTKVPVKFRDPRQSPVQTLREPLVIRGS